MEKKARNPGLYLFRAGIQIPVTAIRMGVHILVIVQLRGEIKDDVHNTPLVIITFLFLIMLHSTFNFN
jgi:hypothetical protein